MSSKRKEPSESRTRWSAWRRRLLLSFATLALALWAMMQAAQLKVVWRSYSAPELTVFRLPGALSVARVSQRWLIIDRAEQAVFSASLPPPRFEMGGLALIGLDRLHGAPLGDGVKGYEGESWAFSKEGVNVTLLRPRVLNVHIPL